MKNYLKMTREGFTLVELMIVVAIIGVLASIAVPQYSKFQAKSRQSEVKIQLGAAYTVEQSFAAENSTYTVCLGQVGYNRDGTKFYYSVGFNGAAAAKVCTPGTANGGAQTCDTYQWRYCDGVSAVLPCLANATPGYTSAVACTATLGSATNMTDFFPANIAEPTGSNGAAIADTVYGKLPTATNTISQAAFTVGAVGDILKSSSTASAVGGVAVGIDGWTIDQNKQMQNIRSGLQ
jgi:type IV pilus assembly protein PilA